MKHLMVRSAPYIDALLMAYFLYNTKVITLTTAQMAAETLSGMAETEDLMS
jgi:hypothetical protein